ncbi:hypothetical protein [Hydrogenimonas cancrithermarum]|uniref:Rhodanese domain-containing protein n=1 Tax=Hydrogenimonas cancrithermarum TaxID=2993563 RepID=A0ABN6WVV8_9BACT|nr:hypothetical protein [Hydrogenimonas cancrithermarum]BDY13122.1 hypothetical protein HCR_14340 [Hydrogenimonas cancrithermarum]
MAEFKDEWTQEEFLRAKKELEAQGRQVLLVDTIAKPIEGVETLLYNPYELKEYPEGTVLLFYCDTGKETKERLPEFRKRFPDKICISLRGGRGYWRKTLRI